jgi:hypothetical protein
MPVRRSKLNYQSVGGSLASSRLGRPVRYDSLLERDFLLVLDLHPAVEWFEEQPMKIPWIDKNGVGRVYVPDVLVRFRPSHRFLGRPAGRTLLVELKHRDDLGKNWDALRPKLRAGVHAAAQQGYRFKILTEMQTRGLALKNAEFIRKHLHAHFEQETADALKECLARCTGCSAERLAAQVSRNSLVVQKALHCIWTLVAKGVFAVDLEEPLSPFSMVFMGHRHEQH